MQEDAAISAVSRENPNSTALSQAVMKTYQDIATGLSDFKDIEKSVNMLDTIFGKVYKTMPRSE